VTSFVHARRKVVSSDADIYSCNPLLKILSMEKFCHEHLESVAKCHNLLTSLHSFIKSDMPYSTIKEKFELQTSWGLLLVESYHREHIHTEKEKLRDMLKRNMQGIIHNLTMLLYVLERDIEGERTS
jgi:hypothetical protein